MVEPRTLERLWWGNGPAARLARAALRPLEAVYAGAMLVRGALYDAGILPSRDPVLPTVSIGNLSVGGTGKTPLAAWTIAELARRGARPAIVLRGYGADEPLVHAILNPAVPVVVEADRVHGVARAAVMGADIAVLDDAFQHRRARRAADVVLVSTEQWQRSRRLLPAGPWREPLGALRRASLTIVTRRTATPVEAQRVADDLRVAAPAVPAAVVLLALDTLHDATQAHRTLPLSALSGSRTLAVAAIGDPQSFLRQLREAGAAVRSAVYPDHFRFGPADAMRVAADVRRDELVVCTLKDAVKLAPHWPREATPLWYVSQRVVVEQGSEAIRAVLDSVLRARAPILRPPAAAG
jgi:tetraacyldisaccharide 4'-kinase